jgi:hypothetical protein
LNGRERGRNMSIGEKRWDETGGRGEKIIGIGEDLVDDFEREEATELKSQKTKKKTKKQEDE